MRNLKITLVFALFVVAATMATQAQQDVQVFVPANASGAFGNPIDIVVPLVPAITVNGPGTVTVAYVSGAVDFGGGFTVGPNGGVWDIATKQDPLLEAQGIWATRKVKDLAALIGVFVPQSRVTHKGFSPIDGTKDWTPVGIKPGGLFFIGAGRTFEAKEAGTLFLGINDVTVGNNSGGFTVEVTGP